MGRVIKSSRFGVYTPVRGRVRRKKKGDPPPGTYTAINLLSYSEWVEEQPTENEAIASYTHGLGI